MQARGCSCHAAWTLALALALAKAGAGESTAHAQGAEPHEGAGAERAERDRYRVFVYDRPQEKNYLRLSLEEIGLLAAGSVEYFQNQSANEGDWDLSYSAESFEKKIAGHALSFDSNKFGTNWITHPIAGWLYYGAARGNRLGPFEALLVASLSSGMWEFVGEYREKVSINDLMVTPVGGAALSESMLQLGTWLERGRPTVARQALSWLLAPTKRIHDRLDDATPLRVPDVERGTLESRAHVAVGPTWENAGKSVRTDVTAGVRTHLFFGPSPTEPGRAERWLDDGNLSTIALDATIAAGALVDARLATRVSYVGYTSKNVIAGDAGPIGNGMFLGVGTGLEYHWHRFERGGGADDQIGLVELLGTTLENWHTIGPLRLRTEMILALDFAGVHSLALDERLRRRGTDGLPTVLIENGYTHAIGGTIGPSLRLATPAFTLIGEGRVDTFRSLIVRDRYYERYAPTVSAADERFLATVGVERTIWTRFDLALKVQRLFRRSRIEEVTRSAGETAFRIEVAVRL